MKVKVKRYNYEEKRPPFSFIDVGEFQCPDMEPSDILFREMVSRCREMRCTFRFYSTSSDAGYDFDAVVIPYDMSSEAEKFHTLQSLLTYCPDMTDEELSLLEENGII